MSLSPPPAGPVPHPRPTPHPRPAEHAREVRRAEPDHRDDLPTDVRGRLRVAYRALADRHGARSIVFGGTAAALAALLVLRDLVTR